jgi:hypothetical protein
LKRLKERDRSENQGVDGRIILKWILGKWGRTVRIGFVHVGTVVNFVVPYKAANFVQLIQLSASQEGLCSMELVSYLVTNRV